MLGCGFTDPWGYASCPPYGTIRFLCDMNTAL